MARTPSNMIPLNTMAPRFNLLDTVSGKQMSLEYLKGDNATVIIFICNHCPFVIHVIGKIVEMAKLYKTKGVRFIGISSNDVENYPLDSPILMKENAIKGDYSFPYLYDESQEVAKAYDAACTPDFYVFNRDLKLKYRGQMDGARPGNGIDVSGDDLKKAMDFVIKDLDVSSIQKPSIGCNIKWKEQL